MRSSSIEEFEAFLAAHASLRGPTLLNDGDVVDGWRVTAFLGKGGHGEVYRVECACEKTMDGAQSAGASCGALKMLSRNDEAARARFEREIALLSTNGHSAFPFFLGAGEFGHPYYVMELLEPVELPHVESDVADYVLEVARAVSVLHRVGLVHRDIKPQNIMRRANGTLVLTDLGLVKELPADASSSVTSATLVDGKAVGVGTPRYAAPEQFNGGVVSPATDIHALGMLANECFSGRPPHTWERIISRSTSSIPERRYDDIDAFIRAVRRRHVRHIMTGCAIAALLGVLAVGAWHVIDGMRPEPSWRTLAYDVQTNVVERKIVQSRVDADAPDGIMRAERVWRTVTNAVKGTVIRLDNRRHSFAGSMLLETNRVYWVVGPGTLDVSLDGKPGSTVCLDGCTLLNRTTNSVSGCGVRYVFRKGSVLKLINQRRVDNDGYRAYVEDFDSSYNGLEFMDSRQMGGLEAESRRQLQLEDL